MGNNGAAWLFGTILFLNGSAFALNTNDAVTALSSIDYDHLRQERLPLQYLENTLLNIAEYRYLYERSSIWRTLDRRELTYVGINCLNNLEQLNQRTIFGRRKIAKQVMKEMDGRILKLIDGDPNVDEWTGRRLSALYSRTLNQLLDRAEMSYKMCIAVITNEWVLREIKRGH